MAWFVLDVVAELDLSGFTGDYRVDGRGGAVYDRSVMLAVLSVGSQAARQTAATATNASVPRINPPVEGGPDHRRGRRR